MSKEIETPVTRVEAVSKLFDGEVFSVFAGVGEEDDQLLVSFKGDENTLIALLISIVCRMSDSLKIPRTEIVSLVADNLGWDDVCQEEYYAERRKSSLKILR